MSHGIVVRERTEQGYEQFDLYSRLNKDRIIILDTDFNDNMASIIQAQLLFLANESDEDISIYVNSPGGSVTSGLLIYDTIQYIKNNVRTIVMGQAASMGAFLLSSGTKGYRYASPNARIMIHQVSGGAQGTTADVRIRLKEQERLNELLDERLALHCGKTVAQIKIATERDYWMSATDAKKFGIIDGILDKSENAW